LATFLARYSSGRKITVSEPRDSTTAFALADVQQISDSALMAAGVFMYVTTGTPGCRSFRRRTSSTVMLSEREQPASGSGMRTVRSGLRILAVSAMK
jgi:hypothetical protein